MIIVYRNTNVIFICIFSFCVELYFFVVESNVLLWLSICVVQREFSFYFFPPFEKCFFVLSYLLINSVICFPWIKIEIEVQLMDSFYNPILSQQSKLKSESASVCNSVFSGQISVDNNNKSYTIHHLAQDVSTNEIEGLSLMERSKIEELDEQWKKQGIKYDQYHLK